MLFIIDLQLTNQTVGPNLVTEIKEYIEQIGMDPACVTKGQWKKSVKLFIRKKTVIIS